MHNSDPKLAKEIDSIIDKFGLLTASDSNIIKDEFFTELNDAIQRSKNEANRKINNEIRKNKIKKINKNENNS